MKKLLFFLLLVSCSTPRDYEKEWRAIWETRDSIGIIIGEPKPVQREFEWPGLGEEEYSENIDSLIRELYRKTFVAPVDSL